MAFALFYNPQDLLPLATQVSSVTLTGAQKTLAQKIWNGGLKNWQTAPQAPVEYRDGDAGTKIIVINAQGVTKADLMGLLNAIADQNPTAWFMRTLAEDMAGTAVEPWT